MLEAINVDFNSHLKAKTIKDYSLPKKKKKNVTIGTAICRFKNYSINNLIKHTR